MAAGDRAESLRRIVEVTGLGIAATYFLDPEHGAGRRRAARRWMAAAIGDHGNAEPSAPPVAGAEVVEAAPEPPVEPVAEVAVAEPPAPPADEVVLVATPARVAQSRPPETHWPRWGWALVVTVTLCAVAAFAAVGVGIWAVEKRQSTTTTVTTAAVPTDLTSAAGILADPTARRITGTATTGRILLRIDPSGGALAVDGLPPLPPKERYRVWVTASGRTTPVGAFAGTSALLGIQMPMTSGGRIAITREPAAGSTARRGPPVATVTVSR